MWELVLAPFHPHWSLLIFGVVPFWAECDCVTSVGTAIFATWPIIAAALRRLN